MWERKDGLWETLASKQSTVNINAKCRRSMRLYNIAVENLEHQQTIPDVQYLISKWNLAPTTQISQSIKVKVSHDGFPGSWGLHHHRFNYYLRLMHAPFIWSMDKHLWSTFTSGHELPTRSIGNRALPNHI